MAANCHSLITKLIESVVGSSLQKITLERKFGSIKITLGQFLSLKVDLLLTLALLRSQISQAVRSLNLFSIVTQFNVSIAE